MEEIKALNDDALEQAAGGMNYYPDNDKLKELGLWDYVRNKEDGVFTDAYYDTWREKEGFWKHVASDDMLKYVERTLGADDERYQALHDYCYQSREFGRLPGERC